jgi:adenylate kinase
VYHEQTKPLVGYYQQMAEQGAMRFASMNGVGNVETITERLFAALQ